MRISIYGGLFLAMLFFLFNPPVRAEGLQLPFQRVMLTDVGKIVLEDTPCPLDKNHNFEWKAYATEEDAAHTGQTTVHEGCWSRDQKIVSIWFYNEHPPLIATYHEMYFKDGNTGQVTQAQPQ